MSKALNNGARCLERGGSCDGRQGPDDHENDIALFLGCRIRPLDGNELIVAVEDTRAIACPWQDKAAEKSQIGNVS